MVMISIVPLQSTKVAFHGCHRNCAHQTIIEGGLKYSLLFSQSKFKTNYAFRLLILALTYFIALQKLKTDLGINL